MTSSNNAIKFDKDKPYVILCEGIDEYYFLIWYLEFLKKKYGSRFKDCYHVIDLGGIGDMKNIFKSIPLIPNFISLKGILFVRDAEQSAESAIASLISNIRNVWNVSLDSDGKIKTTSSNVKVGFYLFPGKNTEGKFCDGTLENLLADLFKVKESEKISTVVINSEVVSYLNRLEQIRNKRFSASHKNIFHLMLSSTDKFVGMKIGEVAKSNGFDFNSTKLDCLRDMILGLQM